MNSAIQQIVIFSTCLVTGKTRIKVQNLRIRVFFVFSNFSIPGVIAFYVFIRQFKKSSGYSPRGLKVRGGGGRQRPARPLGRHLGVKLTYMSFF